jgi:hypothetical protein
MTAGLLGSARGSSAGRDVDPLSPARVAALTGTLVAANTAAEAANTNPAASAPAHRPKPRMITAYGA